MLKFIYSLLSYKFGMFEKLTNYIRESRQEFRHVNWPTRRETIRFTILVIGVSLVVAFFLGALDVVFRFLLDKFVL